MVTTTMTLLTIWDLSAAQITNRQIFYLIYFFFHFINFNLCEVFNFWFVRFAMRAWRRFDTAAQHRAANEPGPPPQSPCGWATWLADWLMVWPFGRLWRRLASPNSLCVCARRSETETTRSRRKHRRAQESEPCVCVCVCMVEASWKEAAVKLRMAT